MNAPGSSPTTAPNGSVAGQFATTRWTRVLAARGETPEARAALGELCALYWEPVSRFLRREGRDEDAARELTQEFFARILAGGSLAQADPERGRFRSFLLGAVKHFLSETRRREQAAKRGGGVASESLDVLDAAGVEPADPAGSAPDTYFDRQWAFILLARAFAELEAEMTRQGKAEWYQTLKPFLVGEAAGLSQRAAAETLGLGEGAVKVAIHRLRRRFREIVRSEVAQTVPTMADTDAEMSYLVEVLAAA